MKYQLITPTDPKHIHFVDEFQKDVKKQLRGKDTLSQQWATPFTREAFEYLREQKSLHIATSDYPAHAVLGFGVAFSRYLINLSSSTQELVDAVCKSVGDKYPLFIHTTLALGYQQNDVFDSILRRCMRQAFRKKYYFSTVVLLEQSNPYLRGHLEHLKFSWEDSFFLDDPSKSTNVFVRKTT